MRYQQPDDTVKSSELNNTPPIYALTQIRTINVIEDKYNIFTEEQKKIVNYWYL